jgi:hypothetical protein
VVGVLVVLATLMGIACITVPGKYAQLSQASEVMAGKQRKAQAPSKPKVPGVEFRK